MPVWQFQFPHQPLNPAHSRLNHIDNPFRITFNQTGQ